MNRRIFVCGDIHGSIDINTLNTKNFPEQKDLTKDDVLLQLGDFGLVWRENPTDEDQYWLNWIDSRNFTTIVIPGNHENWTLIEALPLVKKYNAKLWKYSDSIYFVPRGEILEIDDKKYFCFGGATSTDKAHRIEGISWWKDEVHSYHHEAYALDMLKEHKFEVDFILSHTAPASIMNELFKGFNRTECTTANFLDYLKDRVYFKHWYCGHIHENMNFADMKQIRYASKISTIYQKVKEI